MERERWTGAIGRIAVIAAVEYAALIALYLGVTHIASPTPAQTASAAAVLLALLSVINLLLASRLYRRPAPREATHHLKLLREEFLYLRWYFDEVLESMSSGILVLDRLLTVRSMNQAESRLLDLKEKGELIGKPFRFHPLSKETYNGEIYNYKGRKILDIFESCVREGESILLEDVRYDQQNGREPKPLNILVYPWKNRDEETERLVIRMDDKSLTQEMKGRVDLEKIFEEKRPPSGEMPAPPVDAVGPALREDCETVRDHLEALLTSSLSINEVLEPGNEGPHAELLLFEMQVRRIIGMIRRIEQEIGKGLP